MNFFFYSQIKTFFVVVFFQDFSQISHQQKKCWWSFYSHNPYSCDGKDRQADGKDHPQGHDKKQQVFTANRAKQMKRFNRWSTDQNSNHPEKRGPHMWSLFLCLKDSDADVERMLKSVSQILQHTKNLIFYQLMDAKEL